MHVGEDNLRSGAERQLLIVASLVGRGDGARGTSPASARAGLSCCGTHVCAHSIAESPPMGRKLGTIAAKDPFSGRDILRGWPIFSAHAAEARSRPCGAPANVRSLAGWKPRFCRPFSPTYRALSCTKFRMHVGDINARSGAEQQNHPAPGSTATGAGTGCTLPACAGCNARWC